MSSKDGMAGTLSCSNIQQPKCFNSVELDPADVFLKNKLKISMMMLKDFFTFEKLAINNNSIIPRVIH